ncbi:MULTISPECIES: hypothetical protein [unclassified Stenotrophomonas]|uniref:hypothetical protein n=1 Tax=unclassified Stenotrophomonas TaxID=196198 RepID=UPI000ED86DD9|nr:MULTISPECIES: hypothetical protein [unclassified Stenotrophomonas]RIA19727.1 hypothetical protein DFO63_4104 [Stenotrophomonas sp. AG209]
MNVDRFNPRVWLRNWLLKPTAAEASLGQELPNRLTLTAERFAVVDTDAQGKPVSQPFGCADAQASLDLAFAEKIEKAAAAWAERESRPGGVLHGRGPDTSWTLRKDGNFKIQGMGPSEGQTDEPV